MTVRYDVLQDYGCWVARFEDGITIGATGELAEDPDLFDRLVRIAHAELVADGALDLSEGDA